MTDPKGFLIADRQRIDRMLDDLARRIRPAALCSRGANEVPVHADFVGMPIDVGEENVIEVHAPPFEEEWAVVLVHQDDLAP